MLLKLTIPLDWVVISVESMYSTVREYFTYTSNQEAKQ